MKLHSPRFLKTLRRCVKKTVRSSPELKREFRKANKFRRQYRAAWIGRCLVTLGFGWGVYALAAATHRSVTALALINLWSLAWVFIQAQNLLVCLFRANDLPALALLPVSESTIFRWELHKFFRKSIMLLADLAAGLIALGIYSGFSTAGLLATLPLAVIFWATVLSLAGLCAARLPKLPYPIIISMFYISVFVLLVTGNWTGHVLLTGIDTYAPELNVVLPTGWATWLFQLGLPDGDWKLLGLLLPIGLIIATAKDSLGRLRRKYIFTEQITAEPSDVIPGEEAAPAPPDKPQHLGITAIEEIVQSRQFLSAIDWNKFGWLERQLWHWLNDHEKRLAGFVFPEGFAISKPWLKILRNFLITIVVAFVMNLANPSFKVWVLGLGFFVTFCQVLAQIFASGKAFRLMASSGVLIPFYSNFNVGFHELACLLLKCSAVQLPLVLTYAMICGVLTACMYHFPVLNSLVFGFKCGCLIFAGKFITLTLSFSSGTNDTSRFRLSAVALFFFVVVLGLFFLLLGGASLFVPDIIVSWVLLVAAVFDALSFLWIYSWFYNRGKFDLMKLPQK